MSTCAQKVAQDRLGMQKASSGRVRTQEAPVLSLTEHLRPALKRQLGEGRLLSQEGGIVIKHLLPNHPGEGSQAEEQLLRLRGEVAVGVVDAAQNVLSALLALPYVNGHLACL